MINVLNTLKTSHQTIKKLEENQQRISKLSFLLADIMEIE